jgi:hypothetical protein
LPLSSTLSLLCLNSFWLRCLLLFVVAMAHAPAACASAAQAPCWRGCWLLLMSGLPRLCWFVIGMSMLERLKPNAVMLTHGVASSRTLALRLIMFIGRRTTSPN